MRNATASIVVTLLLGSSVLLSQASQPLVLTDDSFGPLRLGSKPIVSVPILERAFPLHRVTHDICQGDSPDFHCFCVATVKGEKLFVIQSFLKDGTSAVGSDGRQEVPIDLIQVISRQVPDRFGLRVGDRVADVLRIRGDKLAFWAGHHNIVIGGGSIFYSFATGSQSEPTRFTWADAKRANWRIVSISWPYGAWE
jgi:hypothetical protein